MTKAQSIVGFSNDRAESDYYPTPQSTTRALMEREGFDGLVWECACGDGRMAEVIKEYNPIYASDIREDLGYGDGGFDFLLQNRTVPNIITNPPYKLAQQFLERALVLAEAKIAMLLKLVFLESASRYNLLKSSPLQTVYVFSKRQKIYKNGDVGKNSGLIAYAWFVWDKDYNGKPTIEWILD